MSNSADKAAAPVGIDVVITWVDGNDPELRAKRDKTSGKKPGSDKYEVQSGRDNTRFRNNGELMYCLQSLRSFAPWIRTIWLVTDNQRPAFLTNETAQNMGIQVVDHSDLFQDFEWALPTFNSRTLETALWRIPGLAPRFLYMNDDFILTKPVLPSDFFDDEGRVILRGSWKPMMYFTPFKKKLNDAISMIAKKGLGITRSLNLLLQSRSAELAGFKKRYFMVPHVPHPLFRGSQKKFFEENPDVFTKNIKYKFRSTNQISGVYLGHHLELARDNAITLDLNGVKLINGETDFNFTLKKKLNLIRRGKMMFTCLQGYEFFKPHQKKNIHSTLVEAFQKADAPLLESLKNVPE